MTCRDTPDPVSYTHLDVYKRQHEGRFADAEPLAAEALRCGKRFDRANAAGIFGAQMFTLRRHQGRLRELAPVLQRFLAQDSQAATWRPGLAIRCV